MTEMASDFITGCLSSQVWHGLCNAASYRLNGMWAVELDENNITGCPALVGVVSLPGKDFS